MAERFIGEDGGWFCSECGYFHDDYFDAATITECPDCKAFLKDSEKEVSRGYKLSKGAKYCSDDEYPEWLLEYRKENEDDKERNT